MKNYKKIVSFILAAILAFSFAGCGSSNNSNTGSSSDTASEDTAASEDTTGADTDLESAAASEDTTGDDTDLEGDADPEDTAASDSELKVVNVGTPSLEGGFPENGGLANVLGYIEEELNKEGYTMNVVGFAQGNAINEAFASGQVDYAFVGDVPEVVAKSNKIDVQAIALLSSSAAMSIIAGNDSGLESAKDLAGKKIVAAFGTVTHVYLNDVLEANGLSIDDVEIINDPANMATLLAAGNVDAIISTGLYGYIFEGKGIGKVIENSIDKPEQGVQYVVTGRTDFLEENPDSAKAIIRALERSKEYMETNTEEAYELLAEKEGVDVSIIETVYPKENGFDYFDPQITEESKEKLKELSKFLADNEIIPAEIDVDDFINNTYYDEVAQELGN